MTWTPTRDCSATRCTATRRLFARQDVVENAWAIVDPLINATSAPLFEYTPGSWGPQEANRLVADVGGWNTPS